jgi:hypothetical protein
MQEILVVAEWLGGGIAVLVAILIVAMRPSLRDIGKIVLFHAFGLTGTLGLMLFAMYVRDFVAFVAAFVVV